MWGAFHEAVGFESIHRISDTGGMHLEASADLAHRKLAGATEVQQHEHFISSKGQM
jgi:hypothetical protein